MRSTKTRMLLIAALALVVAACGSSNSDPTGDDAPGASGPASGGSGGSIQISGSSTVEPISARVASEFSARNPDVAIAVEGPGTGDGFARFCAGETDISDASRPIKDEEAQECAANGIDYAELHVATDGITVLTNPENDAVSCLDFKDLYALIGPEAEGFQSWSDANELAAELGAGHAPYPDAPLVITAPGEESGTFDTFVELALEDLIEERGQDEPTRADYQASANDNTIVEGITGNPTSLGWVGFAFFEENQDVLRAVAIDGGEGCVEPTTDTIASFEYPLSRPLFIYVNTAKAAEKPELEAYVDFYLSDEGLAAVPDAGYVQLPAADIESTRAAWTGR